MMPDGVGKGVDKFSGVFPTDAGVGDALSEDQVPAWFHVLAAFDEVAFDHHAEDVRVAAARLAADVRARSLLRRVALVRQ